MAAPEFETYEKKLREVFDPARLEFNAILARLSVLFEDLLPKALNRDTGRIRERDPDA
jgi:hypothetical protein